MKFASSLVAGPYAYPDDTGYCLSAAVLRDTRAAFFGTAKVSADSSEIHRWWMAYQYALDEVRAHEDRILRARRAQ